MQNDKGELLVISKVNSYELEDEIDTYNFEVEEFHTYFIGENQILSHNACSGRGNKQAKLKEIANDDKVSRSIRGEMKTTYAQKGRYNVPKGYELAHKRGFEARKGFDYLHSELNIIKNHRLQHRVERIIKAGKRIIG